VVLPVGSNVRRREESLSVSVDRQTERESEREKEGSRSESKRLGVCCEDWKPSIETTTSGLHCYVRTVK
jgi:hypothetical protein